MTNDNPYMCPALACHHRTRTGHIHTGGNVNKNHLSILYSGLQMPLEHQFCISAPLGETYTNKSINI